MASPGPNYSLAAQYSAVDNMSNGYQVSPGGKSLYSVLPTPLVGGPTTPYFQNLGQALQAENGLVASLLSIHVDRAVPD